jgi:ABC-type multidrug transport system fused ATPase/permease subunit
MPRVIITRHRTEDEGEDLPLALRNIDVTIKQGEKVAVCGRTGR